MTTGPKRLEAIYMWGESCPYYLADLVDLHNSNVRCRCM